MKKFNNKIKFYYSRINILIINELRQKIKNVKDSIENNQDLLY